MERGEFDDLPGTGQADPGPRRRSTTRTGGSRSSSSARTSPSCPPALAPAQGGRRARGPVGRDHGRERGAARGRGLRRAGDRDPPTAAGRPAGDHRTAGRRRRGGRVARASYGPGRGPARSRRGRPGGTTQAVVVVPLAKPLTAGRSSQSRPPRRPLVGLLGRGRVPQSWQVGQAPRRRRCLSRPAGRHSDDDLRRGPTSGGRGAGARLGRGPHRPRRRARRAADERPRAAGRGGLVGRQRAGVDGGRGGPLPPPPRRGEDRAGGRLRAAALVGSGSSGATSRWGRPGSRGRAGSIAGLPRGVLHGYLLYVDNSVDMDLTGDAEAAEAAAREIADLATELGEPTLDSFALATRGMAAVRRGGTLVGFADLDEAMLPVLAGRVDPLWSGDIYCTVDPPLRRARRPRPDAASGPSRWPGGQTPLCRRRSCTPTSPGSTSSSCSAPRVAGTGRGGARAHSAEPGRGHGWLAGEGYYTLGEVADSGDAAGAARRTPPGAGARPRRRSPARPCCVRDEGDPAGPSPRCGSRSRTQSRLGRARMLLAVSSWPGGRRAARRPRRSWASWRRRPLVRDPGAPARAAQARAALLLAEGRPAQASRSWSRRPRVYRDQRHRHASAPVHEHLAAAHRARRRTTGPRRAGDRGGDLRAPRRGAGPRPAGPRGAPGGLTEREVEVLAGRHRLLEPQVADH